MPLKRNDGTPYRVFSEPNPLTKDQDQWSPKDQEVVLHNIGKPDDLPHDKVEPPPAPPPSEKKPDPPEEKPPPHPEPPPEPPRPDPVDTLLGEHAVRTWCLPVAENNGRGLIWGDKFYFDCLIVQYLPYQIMLFTTSDKVGLGSVVFPSRYVKTQESVMMYRWWQVVKEQPYANGRVLKAIPSRFAPDFSA